MKVNIFVAADGDIHLNRLKDLLMSLDTTTSVGSKLIDNEINFDSLSLLEKVH